MRIGRNRNSEDIVFSLEKGTPSSSSSEIPSSSSSQASSSSSSSSSSSGSSSCGPFNFTLNTTLGSNPDFPDQWFGGAVGVGVISGDGIQLTLSYDNLNIAGPSFIMDIQIDGQIVVAATVAYGLNPDLYLGKPFSMTRLGVTYCGIFTEGVVILG